MDSPLDVSGVWYGRYFTSTAGADENSFVAHLVEDGGGVSGTITEPDDSGVEEIRRAFVDGSRTGAALHFIKQYDPAGSLAHCVAYSGAISDDGREVTGEWRFSGYHGGFVMNRETFAAEELDEEVGSDEDLPIVLDGPIAR